MTDEAWMLAQAALAIATIVLAATWIIPALHQMREPELLLDIWLPITIVLPMLAFAARSAGAGGSVGGPGWTALGGPIVLAGLFIAAGLLRPARDEAGSGIADPLTRAEPGWWSWRARQSAAAILAGLILLLLGAAHVMHALVGNCAFALAAVLLWVNTPDPRPGNQAVAPAAMRAGLAMIGCVLVAGAHAAAAYRVATFAPALAAVIALGAGLGVGVSIQIAQGHSAVARVALWTGSLGVLFSLGVFAFGALLPRAWRLVRGEGGPGTSEVAYGFGAYAFEAVLLIALPALALLTPRLHRSARISLAGMGAIALFGLAAWRLLDMW